jgi:uncharacterized membrane-anchored protein
MSTFVTRMLIVLGALVVLGLVNHSIYGKERIIRSGETIYLELAPVDPRSLMQGDYMALRFRLVDSIELGRFDGARSAASGTLAIRLDGRRVATLGSGDDALHLRYRIRGGAVWLGTNAYFFEEGSADRYSAARFGEFRLDRDSGEAVLVGLRDGELRKL